MQPRPSHKSCLLRGPVLPCLTHALSCSLLSQGYTPRVMWPNNRGMRVARLAGDSNAHACRWPRAAPVCLHTNLHKHRLALFPCLCCLPRTPLAPQRCPTSAARSLLCAQPKPPHSAPITSGQAGLHPAGAAVAAADAGAGTRILVTNHPMKKGAGAGLQGHHSRVETFTCVFCVTSKQKRG